MGSQLFTSLGSAPGKLLCPRGVMVPCLSMSPEVSQLNKSSTPPVFTDWLGEKCPPSALAGIRRLSQTFSGCTRSPLLAPFWRAFSRLRAALESARPGPRRSLLPAFRRAVLSAPARGLPAVPQSGRPCHWPSTRVHSRHAQGTAQGPSLRVGVCVSEANGLFGNSQVRHAQGPGAGFPVDPTNP